MKPTISVVTPTFNAAAFLPACLASVHAQRSERYTVEHVVVDGGSVDATVELAEAYGCVVLQGKDKGIFDALNKGSHASSGDLLGFLGADDTLLPGALERVSTWFAARTSDWVIGGLRWADGDNSALGDISPPPAWMTQSIYASLGWSCVHHMSTYMTRDFYHRVGDFDIELRYSSDYDFFARALATAPPDHIDETLAIFRRHGQNLSMSPDERVAAENRFVAEKFAPASSLQRFFYRQLLRVWLNGTNPRWFVGKKAPVLLEYFRETDTPTLR